ncbi:MAG: hypothetical protein ACM3PY_14720 [Omnitrophica WOR_2 bacterium]
MLAIFIGILLVVCSICSVISIRIIGTSVRGHEDLNGFHYDHTGG